MPAPAYIITPNYFSNENVSDVQQILDDLAAKLPLIGWTVISSGVGALTIQTPADPDGRLFRLIFSAAASTRLQCQLRDDQLRLTSVREMQITGTQEIELYYGSRYLFINNVGQADVIYASLLSLFPEPETAHDRHTIFFGSRNSTGAVSSNFTMVCEAFSVSAGAYEVQSTQRFLAPGGVPYSASPALTRSYGGARRWYSMWNFAPDSGGVLNLRGKVYNAVLMRDNRLSPGDERSVPVDESTIGVFRGINIPAQSDTRIAVRKS